MTLRKTCSFLTVSILAALSFVGNAFADECESLDKNPQWKKGFAQVKSAFENGRYDDVLTKGEELNYICPRSPALNYYIAASFAAKGDLENAQVYYEIASESTYEFATKPEISKNIFYGRYEAEHPDRTEAAVNALKETSAQYETRMIEAEAKVSELKKRLRVTSNELAGKSVDENTIFGAHASNAQDGDEIKYVQPVVNDYATNMWVGVGVGSAGIISTVVGGVLIGKAKRYSHSGYHEQYMDEREASQYKRPAGQVYVQEYKIGGGYIAGWALIGVGVTATITGAILAGINGYKLSQSKNAYSFGISPNGASFGMTF